MSDDIDIEEHDVLENPLIKRIFPDLSILKKEITDYNNYDHEKSSQSSHVDEPSSTTEAVTGAIEQTKNSCSNGTINYKFKNKIILGSKHCNKHKKPNFKVRLKNAKVCLPNISQFLTKNNKFCKICLILFPRRESLKKHTLLAHTTEKNDKVNENIESDRVKQTNYECRHCNVTFANLGNLNRHVRNVHLHSKIFKSKDTTEGNVTSSAESDLKECFHCHLMFTTQQLLIDHLYEVLNTKKTAIAPNQTCPEDNKQIDQDETKKIEKTNLQKILNIEQEQGIENDNNIKKIYACPICSYCFNVWEFYEAHMKKKHGVNKVKPTSKVSYKPNCKFCDLQYSTLKSYNTHLHKRHKNKILQRTKTQSCNNIKFDNTSKRQQYNPGQSTCIENDVKVMALKTILFKCRQCNIHFLTTESAKTHRNHSFLENLKCVNCQKYFKEKDMNLHLEQHKYSNYFSVINISGEKKVTTKIEGEDTVHRTLHKCPFCAVHFSKKDIFEHCATCETEPSQSTYCKICDILIAENIKISHSKEHVVNELKPSDFRAVEFKKIRNKPIRRKKDGNLKMYEEMYLFNLSYCSVCKCNVARAHYKSRIHLESRCSHFIKYVCKYCGLVFSNKSINTHRKLHEKFSNLSLKDFTFFDLKNGKKILPPIPVFPKCNSCEKHFITKFEVKRHVCYRNNHLTCQVCKMKLSQTAYKLHIPFHDISLDGAHEYKETEKPLISDHINVAPLADEIESKEEFVAIFTCKNCVVSFNLYDEAIEHCHLHTNLDTIYQDTFECSKCQLSYAASCHEQHQRLHRDFPEGIFKNIKFDVINFLAPNDKWLKHTFGSMPQSVVDGIVKNAIYKYETRVKMRIAQNGSPDRTVYKCEKCQCFIEGHAIYKHFKTCKENQKNICNICHLPITSSSSDEHEECSASSKSFRIIEFNGKRDVDVNYKIANIRKYYVLYQCRLCHSVVDKDYKNHLCAAGKECSICGLLLNELDYDTHFSKHKRLTSFNGNFMKVILLGTKPNVNNNFQSNILSKFSGIVCDYSFYKCLNCDVCVRDQRNTSQHYCLIDAAKSKCPKCNLVFDEGKLKGHLKLHDTDPNFIKETILVQTFGTNKLIKKMKLYENAEEREGTVVDKPVKIYKCMCGLHYLTDTTFKAHTKKCNGKVKTKQSKQNCSKCDLTFSPDVLFKHLIEHHGNKDILFQYELIDLNPTSSL